MPNLPYARTQTAVTLGTLLVLGEIFFWPAFVECEVDARGLAEMRQLYGAILPAGVRAALKRLLRGASA